MKFINDKVVMIIGLIATLVTPVLLTRNSCCEIFDFTETGQIGDTIGGITAPIVGLVSIILLYITLKEQRGFNAQQVIDNRVNHLLAIQNDLNALNDITTYKYRLDDRDTFGKGLVDLEKLTQTNSILIFDYLELNGLFRSCVLARVMCGQMKEFSTNLDESTKTSFKLFAFCYLNSIHKFLKALDRANVTVNMMDSYKDKEFDSEIDNLLNEIAQEGKIIEQELKYYKS